MKAANGNQPSVDDLFGCNEDDLIELLGRELTDAGFGSADAASYRRIGAEWLSEHAGQLRAKVYGNAAVQVDAVMSSLGRPMASIVAVILVRRGLERLRSGTEPDAGCQVKGLKRSPRKARLTSSTPSASALSRPPSRT